LKNINTNNIDNKTIGFCIIPYIKGFSSKLTTSLLKHNFNIAYRCNNKLNTFIKTNKDPLPHLNQCNVVYEIACNDCNATYVGQTKRQLNTRIKEHRQNINKKTDISVISEHQVNTGHNFNWDDDTKILDVENSYNKRLISECLHIKRQINSINKKTDFESFPDMYIHIYMYIHSYSPQISHQSFSLFVITTISPPFFFPLCLFDSFLIPLHIIRSTLSRRSVLLLIIN